MTKEIGTSNKSFEISVKLILNAIISLCQFVDQ